MSEWRDAATAPKDGHFLTYGGVAEYEIWDGKTFHRTRSDLCPLQLRHLHEQARSVTHWMPLPAPPVED